ncbi:hypothetical protein SAMN05421848_1037 [Kushneria avicenniae]|uniref:PcfJ-like protein n=1 Tax=Kushneria avicenniae TaxID=402385 RepID=A0A1I1I7F2_9GAMM|nr:hypothetical protein [Kushneria avicenniae]SFC31945.1 hypothetical protein SAMN05421848_1037 [Kushneria avicenniae]
MTTETPQQRIMRLQYAADAVIMHKTSDSFKNLIENNKNLFCGFRIIYSTDALEEKFSHSSLKKIEQHCPTLKKYFYGTGLLFYSEKLYEEIKAKGRIEISLDYSLSFDSNVAEKFRIWERGGSLDKDEKRFEGLVRFIKEGEGQGFNFDYSFFIIENLIDSMKLENHRPFNTIRALKRFDYLEYEKEFFDVRNPRFYESKECSGQRAIRTLHAFHSSSEVKGFLNRRMALYLILLKAIILKEQKNLCLSKKIELLIEFSLDALGAFAKTEIYFAWKLLKHGKSFRFFDPVAQLGKKSLQKIKGMSWDLFAIRYQETLASKSNVGDFYVPFFASFDSRFVELAKACPIRAVIIDDIGKRVITIYLDECEFMVDLSKAISPELNHRLQDPCEKIKRMSRKPTTADLKIKADELELALDKYC